ncbi:MAG: cryptochrome/photolyase family protein [Gammaproteobacteria bacterium]|nr:cryptochrome/photolyase family protein [Gammaproteobacteria bacterium]MBL6898947.1 cryptochrome/photolyase family protein [Gammaproteobacteria bacterium]
MEITPDNKEVDLHLILGNQLFPISNMRDTVNAKKIFMKEDYELCTYQKHHKHKITLFLSSMRSYKDYLEKHNYKVDYQYFNSDKTHTYLDSLRSYIKEKNIKTMSMWQIEDKWFENIIKKISVDLTDLIILKSPMFITTKDEFLKMCPETNKPKYKMTNFYINQRKKLDILMDNGKPVGGKWTYDSDNRKKISQKILPPAIKQFKETKHTRDIKAIVSKYFDTHYGNIDDFNYPTTRKEALENLDDFLVNKFKYFGDYEDSVDQRSHLWFHSNLSSSLNLGLITPIDIINKINNIKGIPINSYEGFIRQIIGWREFMRGLYQLESKTIEKGNFFKHERKLCDSWYEGKTGIDPLDYSIKSTIKHAYSHHIERLMIQVNLMNLCEIEPKSAYNWFMELYIDSSDWVMTPNVYSMGLFADGGIMATKPYICGSNYILKMMNFKKGNWCDIFDGLYWRFIDKNRAFFKTNPRLNMMVNLFDKMKRDRKDIILFKADNFLKNHTK